MSAHHFDPAARGYHAAYRENETNHCPGCGRTHWIIGRVTAECAFCGTALVLADGINSRAPVTFIRRGKNHGKVS